MRSVFNTFLGNFAITVTEGRISRASFIDEEAVEDVLPGHEQFVSVLKAYFDGSDQHLDLPVAIAGTPFQEAVWKAVCDIPYGEVRTYGELAKIVGIGANPRNVGQANGQNKLGVLVPCHRVVAKDMDLAGYAWGLDRKRKLLQMEGALKQYSLFD